MSDRPLGVTILAGLDILLGILFIAGVSVLALITYFFPALIIFTGTFAIPSFVFGIFCFVLGYGLWTLRTWAWWISIVVQALGVLVGWLNLSSSSDLGMGILINIVILAYLIYAKGSFSGSELG